MTKPPPIHLLLSPEGGRLPNDSGVGTRRSHLIATDNQSAVGVGGVEAYEHINLNEVDDSRKPVPANVYTFEVNKLDPVYKKVQNPTSEFFGQDQLVLKGSFTIVDDPSYSGRKVWEDFRPAYKFALVNLKKLMTGTGVIQADGESLVDYAAQFALLNPPARFQALLRCEVDKRDLGTPDAQPRNSVNWFTCKPSA